MYVFGNTIVSIQLATEQATSYNVKKHYPDTEADCEHCLVK